MKKYTNIVGIAVAVGCVCSCLSSCDVLERKQQVGAAVEVNGKYLYYSTLESLTVGLNSEDSARVAEQYVHQWIKDNLLYDNAKAHALPEMEQMVEDYRRSLYMHNYEEYLVGRRMPKDISDSVVLDIYNKMPDRFRLKESIMQGVLIIVPKDAPNMKKLRQWIGRVITIEDGEPVVNGETLDEIEKYVYQNASGYELFIDKWLTSSDIIGHMAISRTDLENRLRTNSQIEVSDSLNIYLLQLTDKHMRGERMPVEYARPEIEKIILNARQVEFLRNERERIYNEAIETGKVKFYEQNASQKE